jgi:ribonuclease D
MQRPQHLVDNETLLARLIETVASESQIGLDTESNGFHAYVERVCLIQIATRDADWAVDPLAVPLRPLVPLLADPAREVILHAAEYDVLCLKRELGLQLGRIFDTHAAAKVLGVQRVGLGNLVADELGVQLTADEQRSDWGRRPLSPEQLAYAFADVQYLLPLREKLGARLVADHRLAEAEAEFARLILKEPRPREFDPEGWQRMKAARFLAEVARRQPKTEDALAGIPGASAAQVRKTAPQILEAVRSGEHADALPRPRARNARSPWGRNGGAPSPEVEDRYERLRVWRKTRAEARKVEVQVIAPNAVLRAIAKTDPADLPALSAVEGMDEFRLAQYGTELLAVLAAARAGAAAPPEEGGEEARADAPQQGKLF